MIQLVEFVDGHGGGAAVYHLAVGFDSAAISVGEGVHIGTRAASVAESGTAGCRPSGDRATVGEHTAAGGVFIP
jgi:hypothetical protein